MKKRAIISTIIVCIIVCLLAVHFSMPYILQAVAPERIADSEEALSRYIDHHMEKGEDHIVVFVKGLKDEDLVAINEKRDCFYGTVASYRLIERYTGSFKRIVFTTNLSENYYVYAKFMRGEEISPENKKAIELYDKVNEIYDNCLTGTMSSYDKEVALHDYLVENCIYDEDVAKDSKENEYHSYGALCEGSAVCNGYAEAMTLLLKCQGIPVEMITGMADGDNHAWNLVQFDGNWYHLDATWDDPIPDQGDKINHTYFNVTDSYMKRTHSFNELAYPSCDATVFNYYVHQGRNFGDMKEWKAQVTNAIFNEQPEIYDAMVDGFIDDNQELQFVLGTQRVKTVTWLVNGVGESKEVILYLTYLEE